MKKSIFFNGLILFFLISTPLSFAQVVPVNLPEDAEWNLAKDDQGVRVYTRFKSGWPLKQFKAVTKVNASVDKLEALLRNAAKRSQWMHNTVDTKDVEKKSDNVVITYSRVEAPWPVSDRDNVTQYTYERKSADELYVHFKAVKGYVPEKSGVVRLYKMEGYWHFKKIFGNFTMVTQVAVSETGGSVPAWLANSSIVDSPFNTLLNLKKILQ